MYNVILTSAPYCYGPTSKLLSLVGELSGSCELTYVGSEPGASLARASGVKKIVPIDSRDHWPIEALDLLRSSDCVVSALDGRAVRVASDHGTRSVFLDTLAWARDRPPPYTDRANAYVIQKFFEPIDDHYLRRIVAPYLVGPIFSQSLDCVLRNRTGENSRTLLVNFGGLTSPAMMSNADVNFILWCAEALHLARVPTREISISIPLHLAELGPRIASTLPGCAVVSPSLAEFHSHLANADVLITVPGLESILEALYLKKSIVFLPPHNGTQLLQLKRYRDLGLGPSWVIGGIANLDVRPAVDLNSLTGQVQRANAFAQECATETERFAHYLDDAITNARHNGLRDRVQTDHRGVLLDNLGTGGRTRTVEIIQSVCAE